MVEHPLSEPDIPVPSRSDRHGSGQQAKSAFIMKQSRSMHNYPQALPRDLTIHKEYSCPDFKNTASSDGFGVVHPSQDRLMYKTLSNSFKEDYQYIRPVSRDLQGSMRSQSVKTHHPPAQAKITQDRDHRLSFSSQSRTRTCNTRNNYLDGYVSVQPKVRKTSRARSGILPNYGSMAPQSYRLHSTAVGHAGFHQTDLRAEM
ncbi:uncharacterized protein LOC127631828 [Xyrauchen texanus]|uniref:uncharacterized protein LOC127631828 n=1 Tax=Xyrauchen texanus TaxID=154827 RepID=UPI002241E901|nr:uncharacterized protein LOC127631828 [Xyrauchen texanus]